MKSLMPAWAEHELQSELSKKVEIQLLREFYDSWIEMHSIPNDKLHHNKLDAACEKLKLCAKRIENMRQPSVYPRAINA